jgi:hypothetical protein
MTILPTRVSRVLFPPGGASRIPTPDVPGAAPRAINVAAVTDAGVESSRIAYLVSSSASDRRAYAPPTLPPGVSFVEEPSGIKIYIGTQRVEAGGPEST